jgi:pimeloyl-ACP methyl ester carboxylesterase
MPYFTHEGIDFHYEIQGDGMPFIFLHGLGGDATQPTGHFQRMEDIRLITMDLRGHGKTTMGNPKQLSFDTFAKDVEALCHHLNIDSCYLGGISMGAAVSMNFALRNPQLVKKLILIRVAWLDKPMEEPIRGLFSLAAQYLNLPGGKEMFKNSVEYLNLYKEAPAAASSFVKYFEDEVSVCTAVKFGVMPMLQPVAYLKELEKLKMPVLILATQQDPVHPFSYGLACKEIIPQADFKEVIPKSVDADKHVQQVKKSITQFLL